MMQLLRKQERMMTSLFLKNDVITLSCKKLSQSDDEKADHPAAAHGGSLLDHLERMCSH